MATPTEPITGALFRALRTTADPELARAASRRSSRHGYCLGTMVSPSRVAPHADKSGCPLWPLTRGPWHLLALLGRRRSLRHVVFGKKKIERFGEKVLDLPSSFGLNKAQGRFNLRGEIGADIDLPCPAHRQRLRLRLPLYRRRGLSRLRRGVSRRHFSGSLALDGFQYAWSRHFSHF